MKNIAGHKVNLPPIGHWEVNVVDNTVYWSDEVYLIHGLEVGSELDIEAAINTYHPEDKADVERLVNRAIEFKEAFHFYLRLIRADGEERAVYASGAPRLNKESDVIAISGSFQDITELKAQQAELIEKTALLEKAEELAGFGHWTYEVSTGALFWSDEIYRIVGKPIGEPLDLELGLKAYHPDEREKIAARLERSITQKENTKFTSRILRPDGEIKDVEIAVHVSLNNLGEVATLFGVLYDITDSKRHEAQLHQAALEADAGNRAKSKFLQSISHEVRTPLNAILGFAQLMVLDKNMPLSGKQLEYTEQIIKGGDHLLSLLTNILDMAKIDKEDVILACENFSVETLISDCCARMGTDAFNRNVSLTINHTHDSLPDICGDRTRVKKCS